MLGHSAVAGRSTLIASDRLSPAYHVAMLISGRAIMRTILAASAAWVAGFAFAPAHAAGPAVCAPGATDDRLRTLPEHLVPKAVLLFNMRGASARQVERSTVVRCVNGRVLVCTYGANLPCGKANTSRELSGGEAWCQQSRNSSFIPAYITGHDTIYRWRCVNGAPVATGPTEDVDARGFIARYWKPLP